MNHEAPKPQVVTTDDLINGLKHMVSDHPCCAATIQLATNMISEMESQRDSLAEALREMRYGHTDKAERMAIAALEYLHNGVESGSTSSACSVYFCRETGAPVEVVYMDHDVVKWQAHGVKMSTQRKVFDDRFSPNVQDREP